MMMIGGGAGPSGEVMDESVRESARPVNFLVSLDLCHSIASMLRSMASNYTCRACSRALSRPSSSLIKVRVSVFYPNISSNGSRLVARRAKHPAQFHTHVGSSRQVRQYYTRHHHIYWLN